MLGCVWPMQRAAGTREVQLLDKPATLSLTSAGLHRSRSLLPSFAFILLFILSFCPHTRLSLTMLRLALSLSLPQPQPFSIKRVQRAENNLGSGIWSWKHPKISGNKKPLL